MADQKFGMEFETKKEAGLMASKTGKYTKSELYEIFNGDTDRSEKMDVLEDIAGDSQAVTAPTRGYPYQPELNSDDTVRDVYFDEIDDTNLSVVPKGEIDRGGDYWVIISNEGALANFREVDKESYEFVKNARSSAGAYDSFKPALNDDFKYETEFEDGLTISGNRNHYVLVPKPSDFDSDNYFSVKFGHLEKMVRLGRGGSYSKRWYQGKTIEHSDTGVARVETDEGFYLLAETLITGFSDEKADLAKVVKLEDNGKLNGGVTGISFVPTEDYSSYEDLKQQVMGSDLAMETFEVVEELKENDISVKRRDLGYDLGRDELESILDISPKPLFVGNEFLANMKGERGSKVDKVEIIAKTDIRAFTGADQNVYDLDKGDVAEIPKPDKQELSFRDYETLDRVKDKIEGADIDWTITRVNDGWNISNGDMRMGATLDYMDNSIKVILQGSAIEKYIDWNDASEGDSIGLGKVLAEDKYRVPKYSVNDIIESIVSTLEEEESELSDSGSKVDQVYDDYYELVNMSPGDIEDRMDNMDCVHKASGDDAVEHLKRNKFIQESNKSEWDSRKVPEEFANSSAESRRVVDQAVRTVSFGKRHLGQLENESITRMEDGCYNPRVEGLKNWAIDPLEMSGFSVDEDRSEESEMSDSNVEYDLGNSRSQNRLSSMSDSAVGQGEVPDVESSQGFGKDVFKSQFGNVDTEVYVDHEDAKKIENGVDAKSHLLELGISDKPNERFVAIYLNGNNEHLGTQVVAMGDQGSVSFDHKSIIRTASMVNARAVIVAHNHPSGNENASDDDLRAIRDLKHDLADVDLDLLDSLVIGGDSIRDISSMRDDTSIW